MKCQNCGRDFNGNFCPQCGTQTKKSQLKSWHICLIAIGAAAILITLVIVIWSLASLFRIHSELKAEITEIVSHDSSGIESQPKDVTFGQTIALDGLEIAFDNDISWTTVDNMFSEHDRATVIKIPVTVKNITEKSHGFELISYDLYDPNGHQLDEVHYYFDDDISTSGKLRPGAVQQKYFHILYTGDGDYYLELSEFLGDTIEVKLPIKKS